MDRIYVLIKVKPGHIETILQTVLKNKYVVEASAVTGSYDIIAKVEDSSISTILSEVVREILKIKGIISTETLVAVDL